MESRRLDIVVPVYRDAARATETISALLGCTVPEAFLARVRIVDDGSADGTTEQLLSRFGDRIDLLRLPRNMGRSAARNAGAAKADADLLLFVDADCVPDGKEFLRHHLEAIRGAHVSMGRVDGQDDGFWHEYQQAAAVRRERLARRSSIAKFTTQNVMIDAKLFGRIGGFDEEFRGYGFEDRDLAIRLMQAGADFRAAGDARVFHRDSLILERICAKMHEAGETTSARFARLHPVEYRNLGYEAIDARKHPWRGLVARLVSPLLGPLIRHDKWLNWRPLPFSVRKGIVRVAIAVSFLRGTAGARR